MPLGKVTLMQLLVLLFFFYRNTLSKIFQELLLMALPPKCTRTGIVAMSWLLIILIVSLSYNKNINKGTVSPITIQPVLGYSSGHYLIEENTKCAGGPPFLMLLIPSSPQDALIRDVLRKTWANENLVDGISIKRLFLLGSSLNTSVQEEVKRESEVFHDIIQQDFLDSYNNLTLKTLMGIEWISRLCPNVSYVMKIDSDMFFNPWFLVQHILQPQKPAKVGFFSGLVVEKAIPYRNKDSKWYMPTSMYSKTHYPPYCSGTGYIFSGDLADKINTAKESIPLFPYEDVFMGICLEIIGVKISRPLGAWFVGERFRYNRCQFAKLVMVHHYGPDELLKLWPDFTEAVKTCT
ncbi:beta-1,3-galactosyltransferase 2-like [Pelobates cultripes]|uniref:Hexosyltransferase n=2 Tax=Pelobates cultripes TaxID=61616 RepID=A0AAD1R4D0_PELCU|nr:beta-1,3-galactosyltransferase 2-like [Pelobates cultripes]